MKIKNESLIKKIISWGPSLLNHFDNFNQADSKINGEDKFLENLAEFYSGSEKQLVIFDVGANVGDYSESLINQFVKHRLDFVLHIFEPSRETFVKLQDKFGNLPNVILNNFALSNRSGEFPLFKSGNNTLNSLHSRDLAGQDFTSSEMVHLKRLDDYISEQGITKINFLKLDVEGHELAVLDGLGQYADFSFIDFIQFEYGGCNIDSHTTLRDLYAFCEAKKFVVYKVMPRCLEKRTYHPHMDNFLYSNFVALGQDPQSLITMSNLKTKLKNSFIYDLYKLTPIFKAKSKRTELRALNDWLAAGRPVPPPHSIKQDAMIELQKRFNLKTFIETGTFTGGMVESMRKVFPKIFSIELDDGYWQKARKKFRKYPQIVLLKGDSVKVLPELLKTINTPCLFWLDGHYSGGLTAKGDLETPIRQELEIISKHHIKNHVITIDDARMFVGASDYPTLEEARNLAASFFPGAVFEVIDDIIRIYQN